VSSHGVCVGRFAYHASDLALYVKHWYRPGSMLEQRATSPDADHERPEPSGLQQARIDLAAAHRLAVRDDLNEGTWSHLSVAVPGAPREILISPGARHWSQVRASDLAHLTGSESREELERVSSLLWVGYRIHQPVHAARPDAACVLHTHPPFATALTMVEDLRLEMAEQNAVEFDERIAYADEYDGGPDPGMEHGERIARALGETATVLFLKSHGVIVVGPSVAVAYTNLYMLERACRVFHLARGYGRPLALIPERLRASTDDQSKIEHFAAMKRVLDVEESDYQD
jgi:ribulose-5-phosphate 4-epimerase/fuculose-1-phosphate aldolase